MEQYPKIKVERSDSFSEDSDISSLIQKSGAKSDSGGSGEDRKQKSSGRVRINFSWIY